MEPFGTTWAALAAFWLPFEPQLGPKGLPNAPGAPQNEPKDGQEEQSGSKRYRKGTKSELKAAKREPKAPQREPIGAKWTKMVHFEAKMDQGGQC